MVFTTQHFHISSISQAPRTSKVQVWDPPARMSSAGPIATGRASARRERPPKPSWPSWKDQDFATWRWENLWKSMNIYEDLWKSMKIWYFYIVTPPKSSSFDHGFPTENRYFTCCSQFSHPTGKFGREPESGDKPDTNQISNILVQHVPNKQQGIRPKCRFHQQIKRGTPWVANSCS